MNDVTSKVNLLNFDHKSMREYFESIGEKPFRADQMMKWIYHFGYSDFEQMTNLNKKLREKLQRNCEITAPEISEKQVSEDGTIKYALKLEGGQEVETVWIPENDRATLCVSSQVGCALECTFCATAQQGFNRNLSMAEIIGQVWRVANDIGATRIAGTRPITNIVMMGMGEPLMNFDPVVDAMSLMMEDNAYGLSKRRVTLSTAGLVPGIDRLGERLDVSLALSLHAPNDALRDQLVPLNKRYPISEVKAACQRYLDRLNDKRVITIEYTMMDGVNDSPEQARELVKLLKDLPCKLNLIPFNPFPNSGYRRSKKQAIDYFKEITSRSGIVTTVRTTRGEDIDAACGQLVGQVEDRTRRSQKYIPIVQDATSE